jgi:para-nitrobenzyl esterase
VADGPDHSPRAGAVHRRGLLAGAAAAVAALNAGAALAQTGPIARTAAGRVRGYQDGPVHIFKGIRYGASTAGANRFQPPRRPEPWTGVADAVRFAAKSPQGADTTIPEVSVSLGKEAQGEDCLFLNVWSAGLRDGKRRPVMVWFHGGGYARGSGASSWYDGTNLAARHEVVVVTVNHRLNVVGYLQLAEFDPRFADSGNAGMLDCVAALQWVRDNIAEFGGDPGNVTIFGESGGGGKVSTLMGIPAANGLFHRAIAESGTALRGMPKAVAAANARILTDRLGLQPGQGDKLQALPIEAIMEAADAARLNFAPVVDGRAIPRDPFSPDAPAQSAQIPLLLGSNLTEVNFFPATPLEPMDDAALHARLKVYIHADDAQTDALIALYRSEYPGRDNSWIYQLAASDWWMRSDVGVQADRKAAQAQAPVYVYHLEWLSPVRGGKLRCPHGLDIPLVFDNVDKAQSYVGDGPAPQALADKMSAAWVAFARSGKPEAPGLPAWAPYEGTRRATMVFDTESRLVDDPNARLRVAMAGLKAKQAHAG